MIREPKPAWLKVRAPSGERYASLKATLRRADLHTVCEEARCPNVGECWGAGTATFMLLGDVCTRGCRFCAVTTGNPRGATDPREPDATALAIRDMGLRYVVLTMVDRDDLLDGGAAHVARTIEAIHAACPDTLVEALVGDFAGRKGDVETVLAATPEVFAHNVETVPRLQRGVRDARCGWDRSLEVLRIARQTPGNHLVKTSIMLGLGETDDEIVDALRALRAAGCDALTLGQYLRPSEKHHEVLRWVTPQQFDELGATARQLGFVSVASGPLVRSSYRAGEYFLSSEVRARRQSSAAEGAPRKGEPWRAP